MGVRYEMVHTSVAVVVVAVHLLRLVAAQSTGTASAADQHRELVQTVPLYGVLSELFVRQPNASVQVQAECRVDAAQLTEAVRNGDIWALKGRRQCRQPHKSQRPPI